FPEDKLREILRSQRLRSVQEVLEIYGNGVGCEICKPALSYMVDMLWCGDHDEDRSARFINDRVHANIQKDGPFSVVPSIRGGVPAQLRGSDRKGHRPCWTRGKLASGGGWRGRQESSQGGPADHRGIDGGSAPGGHPLFPVLPGKRKLSGTYVRLRRTQGD